MSMADELLLRRRELIREQVGLDKLHDWLPKWDAWERDVARYLDDLEAPMPKKPKVTMVPLWDVVSEPCKGCGKRPVDFIS